MMFNLTDLLVKLDEIGQRQLSKKLLYEQQWVLVEKIETEKIVFIFRTNAQLLSSRNGIVTIGRFEMITDNNLLVNVGGSTYLYKTAFFDEYVLLLKRDGVADFTVFVNQTKYGKDIDGLFDLKEFIYNKYILPRIQRQVELEKNKFVIDKIYKLGTTYSLKMGWHEGFKVQFTNGRYLNIYKKLNNNKFFYYKGNEILVFPDSTSCVNHFIQNYS